jgi:hypothetical protein
MYFELNHELEDWERRYLLQLPEIFDKFTIKEFELDFRFEGLNGRNVGIRFSMVDIKRFIETDGFVPFNKRVVTSYSTSAVNGSALILLDTNGLLPKVKYVAAAFRNARYDEQERMSGRRVEVCFDNFSGTYENFLDRTVVAVNRAVISIDPVGTYERERG